MGGLANQIRAIEDGVKKCVFDYKALQLTVKGMWGRVSEVAATDAKAKYETIKKTDLALGALKGVDTAYRFVLPTALNAMSVVPGLGNAAGCLLAAYTAATGYADDIAGDLSEANKQASAIKQAISALAGCAGCYLGEKAAHMQPADQHLTKMMLEVAVDVSVDFVKTMSNIALACHKEGVSGAACQEHGRAEFTKFFWETIINSSSKLIGKYFGSDPKWTKELATQKGRKSLAGAPAMITVMFNVPFKLMFAMIEWSHNEKAH
jgi:hypothetical protein